MHKYIYVYINWSPGPPTTPLTPGDLLSLISRILLATFLGLKLIVLNSLILSPRT